MVTITDMHAATPPALGLAGPSKATDALLDLMGPVRDQHVLVVGPGALEMMCALNTRGAVSVICVQAACRARAETVDVTVAPNVFTLEAAEIAILRALKSTRPNGQLYLRFDLDDGMALVSQATERLRHHGFGAAALHRLGNRTVLAAPRPAPCRRPGGIVWPAVTV